MDQIAHLYAGHYKNETDDYLVFGSFVHIPKNTTGSVAPVFDVLMVNYNARNESSGNQEFTFQKYVYVLVDGNLSNIGDILNQRPLPIRLNFQATTI